MQLQTLLLTAVLGLASKCLARPTEVISTPTINSAPAVRDPSTAPAASCTPNSITAIVASIVGLPDTLPVNDLGTAFPGLIAFTGTAIAPLNNGPATFTFLTSVTNELTGTTITQTVDGVTQSLTLVFTTPVTLGTLLIRLFFRAAVQGQQNFDDFIEILIQSVSSAS